MNKEDKQYWEGLSISGVWNLLSKEDQQNIVDHSENKKYTREVLKILEKKND
jgi:hypothetical protein